jgi:hypothetical protein
MATMERKKVRPRRSFTPEFQAEIVERCKRGDRSIGQVAKDFDLTETAVRAWGMVSRGLCRLGYLARARGQDGFVVDG